MTKFTSMVNAAVDSLKSSVPPVLVVDDDPAFQGYLQVLIEKQGMEYVGAQTVPVAQEVFDARFTAGIPYPFAVVFLDLRLNCRGGNEVLTHIKGHCPQQPVIIVSGYLDYSMLGDCAKIGYVGLAEKPYEVNVAIQTLALHRDAWLAAQRRASAPGGEKTAGAPVALLTTTARPKWLLRYAS